MERPGQAPHSEEPVGEPRVFLGYAPPTSSTTYTPNQFFDVVLPHASRGCLRLVAYLMRRTLGWSDENGNPENPEAHVSYRELIELGGIGRGRIKEAIAEATERRFITCLRFGQPHRPGEEGFSALYSLRWSDRETYITDPQEFDGFFAGNGNLTYIPNEFFDYTIPKEKLGVIKVIGVIIRNTIGWQTKFGYRRQQVALSFTEIMRRSGISSRSTVNDSIREALEGNHIRRISEGVFDPHNPVTATYGILWADEAQRAGVEPKSANGSEIEPGDRFQNRTRMTGTVPKSNQVVGSEIEPEKRSKIEPAKGSRIEPGTVPDSNRQEFQNRTSNKITNTNNTPKQQQSRVDVEGEDSLALLKEELIEFGVQKREAERLVANYSGDVIRRQLDWISRRRATSSRTGLLITSIERDMPEPSRVGGVQTSEQSAAARFAAHFAAELGGNAGDPVGQPAASDETAAVQILQRLGEPESLNAAALGRAFARYVAKADQGSRSAVRTLPLAVRLYGNAFVAAQEPSGAAAGEKGGSDALRREERVAGQYAAFVREMALRVEEADPSLSENFEKSVEDKARSMARMSERAAQMHRSRLSSEEGRAELLAEYLREKEPGLIPSRAQWEQEIFSDRINVEQQMGGEL